MSVARTTILLGFFGSLLLTTMVAASSDHWGTNTGISDLMGQLSAVLLALVGASAFVFWFGIALDLIRLGKRRRLAAVDWWYKVKLNQIGIRWVERTLRTIAQAVVGDNWWGILLTFYLAPLMLIVSTMGIFRLLAITAH